MKYSDAERKEIKSAFAKFDGFQTPYAPTQMVKGDVYQKTGASEDGVNMLFKHMTVYISQETILMDMTANRLHCPMGLKRNGIHRMIRTCWAFRSMIVL